MLPVRSFRHEASSVAPSKRGGLFNRCSERTQKYGAMGDSGKPYRRSGWDTGRKPKDAELIHTATRRIGTIVKDMPRWEPQFAHSTSIRA